jgi:homoserine O-acetyltransferase
MLRRKPSIIRPTIILLTILLLLPAYIMAAEQQFFPLGNFALEMGGTIKDCTLGYRTYGTLNSARSNAILFPTWYAGTSSELEAFIGPGKMLDTSRYFVIGIDSFGNGISSSPSNSTRQKGRSFPEFTVGDMVKAQYRLVMERFGISRLHAVIGISMGGMQAFYWAAAYPDKSRKIIPITASPRPTSFDFLFFQTQLAALDGSRTGPGCDGRSLSIAAGLNAMASNTPSRFISLITRDKLASRMEKEQSILKKKDPLDLAWQIKAVLTHDIYALPEAPANIARLSRSSFLAIISKQDIMLNPAPAREFTETTGTQSIIFDSDCGHYIFQCESAEITAVVSRFLEMP